MLGYLNKWFRRDDSSRTAKERLHLVLVHDRANVSPHVLESLKEELIAVISKYMEFDQESIEVSLDRDDESVALVANIPIREVKRNLGHANS